LGFPLHPECAIQTYPQMAGGFGSVVDRVDMGEYHRVKENSRFLTGYYLKSQAS